MLEKRLKKKIEEAKKVHNDFYDYSLVFKDNPKTIFNNTTIICPKHGEFEMSLKNHIGGKQECPKCSGIYHHKNEEFIALCKEANKDKNYDFSQIEYKNCKTNVKVICHEKDVFGNEHGEFWIRPDHLRHGHGCPKCAHRYLTNEEWIAMAEKVHGKGTYDYSLINYPNKQKEKGKFICHKKDEDGIEHGIFEQSYGSHLSGCGCPKCKGGVKHTGEIFEKNAKKVHGDRYEYYPNEYVNAQTKIRIGCKIHGDFYQTPTAHLSGEGCPYCKNSILEDRIQRILENNDLYFEKNAYIGLGKQSIDFYIPQKKVYIECQGEQHYVPTKFQPNMADEEAEELLKIRTQLDSDKFTKILELGCQLIYYTDINTFHNKDVDVNSGWYRDKKVFTKLNDIKEYVKQLPNYDYDYEEKEVKKPTRLRNHVTKRIKWTYERCEEEAKKYRNKYEMKLTNQSAYNASVRYGWIDIFFPDSQNTRNWNILENVLAAAKRSTCARDMVKRFGGAYNSAVKHGWKDLLEYKKEE
jgi:hypothetical protein